LERQNPGKAKNLRREKNFLPLRLPALWDIAGVAFPSLRHCEYSFRTETESVMTLVEEYGDEVIRDLSSLRGAQRRSNPEGRVFPDCFVAYPIHKNRPREELTEFS
jgi:hypothetical protein